MSDRKHPGSENPFSFLNFVNGEVGEEEEQQDQHGADGANRSNDQPARREDNPFSFTQFLKQSDNSANTGAKPKIPSVQHRSWTTERTGSFRRKPPDLATDLPDFVQDHLVIESSLMASNDSSSGQVSPVDLDNLPDFAVNGTLPNDLSPSDEHVQTSRPPEPDITADPLHKDERVSSNYYNLNSPSPTGLRGPSPGGRMRIDIERNNTSPLCNGEHEPVKPLPDFLSDGPMMSGHFESDGHEDLDDQRQWGRRNDSDYLQNEIKRLQDENSLLQSQLRHAQIEAQDEAIKVARMQRDLEKLKQKERKETVKLEEAVDQVESNLQSTTSRVVKAEAIISNLKEEVKSLQGQVQELTNENEVLRQSDGHSILLCKKAKNAASNVKTAAAGAEHNLQQLLKGVEALKLIASTLENIDAVHESWHGEEGATGGFG